MKPVHLTDLAGRTVSIVPEHIVELRPVNPGEAAPGAKTIVVLDGATQAVRETAAEIEAKLKE